MNNKQIKQIQKVIDAHRKEAYVTCRKTCPCWDFQNIIDKWEEKHNASPSDNKDFKKVCQIHGIYEGSICTKCIVKPISKS